MILEGNQRGGSRDLALHLLKEENDHVEVHEISGFVSDDLVSALDEAHALSKSTRAKQYLFSLSLNPPKDAQVSIQNFKDAIKQVEQSLKLEAQPRAIVFHEKEGRRHCHVVWSRTDIKNNKAVPLPHTKRKLMEISRGLYVQHGWTMPPGMAKSKERDPTNFSHSEWQQAKRIGKDPRAIKQVLQECWATSDNQSAFSQALQSKGYKLAKGDKGRFVALDHQCNLFNVSKWVGLKAKDIKAKLGKPDNLKSVLEAKSDIAQSMTNRLDELHKKQNVAINVRLEWVQQQKDEMREEHRHKRANLEQQQTKRRIQETKERQKRFRKGFSGIWDRFTGAHHRIRRQNEYETQQALERDTAEKEKLIFTQLQARQNLQKRIERLGRLQGKRNKSIQADIQQYKDIHEQKRDAFETRKKKRDSPSLEH